jgi:hypothetical protein
MSRNQLSPSIVTQFEGSPIFTVDTIGNVKPTTPQSVTPEGNFLIQPADPTANSQYQGYVCAWRNGACRCSTVISNLGVEPHMMINDTPYTVKSTAPSGDYTLYTTTSEIGTGPTPAASVGDVHIGS